MHSGIIRPPAEQWITNNICERPSDALPCSDRLYEPAPTAGGGRDGAGDPSDRHRPLACPPQWRSWPYIAPDCRPLLARVAPQGRVARETRPRRKMAARSKAPSRGNGGEAPPRAGPPRRRRRRTVVGAGRRAGIGRTRERNDREVAAAALCRRLSPPGASESSQTMHTCRNRHIIWEGKRER